MPVINNLSLRNTLGAGIEAKERSEFNALRSDAFREQSKFNALRSDEFEAQSARAATVFDEKQVRANTEFLARGSLFVIQNPDGLPGFIQEGKRRGLFEPDFDANLTVEELLNTLPDMNKKAMAALSGLPQQFGQPVAGLDADGNPIFRQFDKAGGSQDVEGFVPPERGLTINSGAQRFFENLTEGLPEEEQLRAIKIELGLSPRAVGSGTITTATTPDLTEQVAECSAVIAERKKFGELTGSLRSKRIDKGFVFIEKIDKNIRNLDRAILAIDRGASTGVIESRFFPSFRESTLNLEQIQNELGLDVIGSVTFGALSKGELDLALKTALPTGLQPPELRKFLEDKRSAQEKLRQYYFDQIDFLDQGGSIAGFLRSKQRQSERGNQAPIEVQRIKFDAQGNPIAN